MPGYKPFSKQHKKSAKKDAADYFKGTGKYANNPAQKIANKIAGFFNKDAKKDKKKKR